MINPFSFFYNYTADIFRYEQINDGAVSRKIKKLIYKNVACRYSYNSKTSLISEVAKIENDNTLFFDREIDIKEGDFVIISNGVSLQIGECARYTYQIECRARRCENV